jgi:ABC-type nickel/cobalt efflux system permease component RcnA
MLAWVLNLLSSVLIILLAFWLTGWAESRADIANSIKSLEEKKAPYTFVIDEMEKHKETDKAQDVKMETMRIEWREDHKEILMLIRAMK